MTARNFIAVTLLCSLLAACGARGDLDAPPGSPKQAPNTPITLDKLI